MYEPGTVEYEREGLRILIDRHGGHANDETMVKFRASAQSDDPEARRLGQRGLRMQEEARAASLRRAEEEYDDYSGSIGRGGDSEARAKVAVGRARERRTEWNALSRLERTLRVVVNLAAAGGAAYGMYRLMTFREQPPVEFPTEFGQNVFTGICAVVGAAAGTYMVNEVARGVANGIRGIAYRVRG